MDVSVILPVRDNPDLIRMALDSVLKQEEIEFEVIVVNDASGPETGDMLAGIADPRVRVETRPCRGGVSKARNTGLELARGEFIAFADAGDAMLPGALSSLYAQSGESDIVIGGYKLDLTDDMREMNALGEEPFPQNHMDIAAGNALFSRDDFPCLIGGLLDGDLLHPVSNKLYRRSFLRGIRFDETVYLFAEDELFNLAVLERARQVALAPVFAALVNTSRPGSLSVSHDDDRLLNLHKLADAYAALLDSLRVEADSPLRTNVNRQVMLHYLSLLDNLKKATPFSPPSLLICEAEELLDDPVFLAAAERIGLRREQLISTVNMALDSFFPELRRSSWLHRGERGRMADLIGVVECLHTGDLRRAAEFADSAVLAGARRRDAAILLDRLWSRYDE